MDKDYLQLIEEHGLSIRRIPFVVEERYAYRHFDSFRMNPKYSSVEMEGDKVVCKRVPENAGWWMSKRVNNTSSMVRWSSDTDNLAPTLRESINKCLGI